MYTLDSAAALHAYGTEYYPKHQLSLQELFDVTVHGFWSAIDAEGFRFYVLLSYPEGSDPAAVRQQYRQHPTAAANMPGFDPAVIRDVSVTLLAPAAGSPLQ
ncbi:MAG TPA: hypothetical protein VIT42_13835 [Microlunatus sp.]